MNILNRRSNNINIAQFWENVQFDKYNFEPNYQRSGEVWNENKKSFLIDSILKNFPMPPIFLHEHIDIMTGKTIFDVIDGKQRLSSIISFIRGYISIPDNFSEDGFGDDALNGLYFKDLEKSELREWKKAFWRYEITIEYVDTDQDIIVNNIFDRLNRNGEPLNPQELRKAKFNQTDLYELVSCFAEIEFWKTNLSKLEINRYDDVEFVSELLFLLLEAEINESNRDIIDNLYDKYCTLMNDYIKDNKEKIRTNFLKITSIIEGFNLDLKKYKINSVSHLYGLWGFAWQLEKMDLNKNFSSELNTFYSKLRNKDSNPFVQEYSSSMQAGTKSKSRRKKRINALLGYCDLDIIL